MFQTFRHGFPHQPTAVAFDPVQRLLAIGTKSGSLRMYPFITFLIRSTHPGKINKDQNTEFPFFKSSSQFKMSN